MATQRHDGDKNRSDSSDKNSLCDRTVRKDMSNHNKGVSQNEGGPSLAATIIRITIFWCCIGIPQSVQTTKTPQS